MGVSGRQFSPDVGEHPWSRVSLSRLHAGPMTEGQHPHTHPRGRWESAPHTSLCLCDKVAGRDVVGGRRKDTGALCQCGVGAAEGVTEAGSQGEGGWGPHTTPAGEGGGGPSVRRLAHHRQRGGIPAAAEPAAVGRVGLPFPS